MKKYNQCILILLLGQFVSTFAIGQKYNVKTYGAKGDGVADDSKAFTMLAEKIGETGGEMIIPYGKYKISKPIGIKVAPGKNILVTGVLQTNKRPVIFSPDFINLLIIEGNWNAPSGNVTVLNIEIIGNNVPYSKNHPFFDKPNNYKIGIGILNNKTATIKNCVIRNVYGQGIYVGNTAFHEAPLNCRFSDITITGNQIIDTWGLNPTPDNGAYDEYGDGIYINNIARGMIQKNIINNDLRKTRQFGRAGIVLEYNVENCVIDGNKVNGYDRNIHFEEDLGNNTISNNTLTGSDFGILIWNSGSRKTKPLKIYNNYISNENIPSISGLITVRNRGERALLSIESVKSTRGGSDVYNNKLFTTSKSHRTNDLILRNKEKNIIFRNNSFSSDLPVNIQKARVLLDNVQNKTQGNKYQNTQRVGE